MADPIGNYENVLAGLTPWAGEIPEGFEVNCLDQLFDISLHVDPPGGGDFPTPQPKKAG